MSSPSSNTAGGNRFVVVPPLPEAIPRNGVLAWLALCHFCSWEHQIEEAGCFRTPPFIVTIKQLAVTVKCSYATIKRGLNELERSGYITKSQTKNEDGDYGPSQYILYSKPVSSYEQVLTPFFDGTIRALKMADGVMWFCYRDICNKLHIPARGRCFSALDSKDWRQFELEFTRPINSTCLMDFVSLSGLFTLVLLAKDGPAKQFRLWVTGYLLPHIVGVTSRCMIPEVIKRGDVA